MDILQMLGDAKRDGIRQMGELRKAGAILNANPGGLVISELIFPPQAAGGELSEVYAKFGPDAVNRTPSATYDPTL